MSEALFEVEPTMERAARISDDGLYRYALLRRWSRDESAFATFIMLNPSTADAEVDDPTIRRCIAFAKAWGMGALHVVNLYALRSTDPRGLWSADDPVGPENDRYLTDHAATACTAGFPLIAAWGANARADRVADVLALPGMVALTALGVTKDGAPRHPLYLRADSERRHWPPAPTTPCPACGGAGIVDTSPPGVETAPWLATDTDCPDCAETRPTTEETT